jgi:hypothetical protein
MSTASTPSFRYARASEAELTLRKQIRVAQIDEMPTFDEYV